MSMFTPLRVLWETYIMAREHRRAVERELHKVYRDRWIMRADVVELAELLGRNLDNALIMRTALNEIGAMFCAHCGHERRYHGQGDCHPYWGCDKKCKVFRAWKPEEQ